MTRKRNICLTVSLFMGVGAFAVSLINKKRLGEMQEKIEEAKNDTKSILRYQENKNVQVENQLEELREEVGAFYEHFEEFSKENEDGR